MKVPIFPPLIDDVDPASREVWIDVPRKVYWAGPTGVVEWSERQNPQSFSCKRTTTCVAVQYSDQMLCKACDLTWDTNDPDRPVCRPRVTDFWRTG